MTDADEASAPHDDAPRRPARDLGSEVAMLRSEVRGELAATRRDVADTRQDVRALNGTVRMVLGLLAGLVVVQTVAVVALAGRQLSAEAFGVQVGTENKP